MVLVANTDYFEGRPFLDRVDVDLAARGDEYADLFRAGQIDSIATNADFLKDPGLAQRVELCPSLSVQYIGMNFRRRSLADRRLRQAVNYAIDKERIVATYAGRARAVAGPLPAGVFAHDPDLRGYRYDPAMARRLVAEIGGVKEPLKFHCRSGREAEERAGLISQMINSIGVPCQLVVLPPAEFNRESSMAQADLYMMGWIGDTGDPDNFLQPLFHSRSGSDAGNRGSFRNAEVGALRTYGSAGRACRLRKQRIDVKVADGRRALHAGCLLSLPEISWLTTLRDHGKVTPRRHHQMRDKLAVVRVSVICTRCRFPGTGRLTVAARPANL
ncbi:MAG: ABC-type dipeptide transport system, periplasmic component [Firmicutes bacterium]|nr:ABC-type dipeptide transport system, periplasmic component [Bacillota bacterium]